MHRPFARHGLTASLLWLLLISIIALNVVDVAWFTATATVSIFAGITVLIWPVRGVRARIREAKQRELARVDGALGGDPRALSGSPIAGRSDRPTVADLLAWRAHVDGVREWPFDTLTIVRFALYLGIPLGSWLGGAVVERLLEVALE